MEFTPEEAKAVIGDLYLQKVGMERQYFRLQENIQKLVEDNNRLRNELSSYQNDVKVGPIKQAVER